MLWADRFPGLQAGPARSQVWGPFAHVRLWQELCCVVCRGRQLVFFNFFPPRFLLVVGGFCFE